MPVNDQSTVGQLVVQRLIGCEALIKRVLTLVDRHKVSRRQWGRHARASHVRLSLVKLLVNLLHCHRGRDVVRVDPDAHLARDLQPRAARRLRDGLDRRGRLRGRLSETAVLLNWRVR